MNERKGIALASLTPDYTLTEIARREGCGRAVIAADIAGPLSFRLLDARVTTRPLICQGGHVCVVT